MYFTVEEENLICLYHNADRRRTAANLRAALGALGAFSGFLAGAGFCAALPGRGASFCLGEAVFSLSALGGRPRRFGDWDCSSCFGPASLEGTGEAAFSGAFASCWAAARSVAFFSAMISEKLKTDTLAAFSLGASAALSCEAGASCAGASALSGAETSGAGCSCLGACAAASGWAGAGPEPGSVASVTIFAFSSAIRISSFLI